MSKSIEHKLSEIEKLLKERRQDAKDDAVVKRSQRSGNYQGAKGRGKYPRFGERIENNEYYEETNRRQDDAVPISIPIGFTRYRTKILDVTRYRIVHFGSFRVALLRHLSWPEARFVLRRIYQYGPASAGYTIAGGDTLVPASLSPADKAILASL